MKKDYQDYRHFVEVVGCEIQKVLNNLDYEALRKAADLIEEARKNGNRMHISGIGKPAHLANYLVSLMSSTGTPAYFLHPAESTHGDSGVITRNDVIIAISNSGETQELMNLLPLIKRFGCPMIGMTGNTESTLAKASEVVLDISVEREADTLGKAPTASTTATLAMGDALAVCLMKEKGFTKEDFLMYHPSGKLGKGLTYKVLDLMLTGERMPIISENTSFQNMIYWHSKRIFLTILLIHLVLSWSMLV